MNDLERDLYELKGLTDSDLAGLPLVTRVMDRLIAVMVLTHEMRAEVQTEEATAIHWLEPHIQRVYDEVDWMMGRFVQ